MRGSPAKSPSDPLPDRLSSGLGWLTVTTRQRGKFLPKFDLQPYLVSRFGRLNFRRERFPTCWNRFLYGTPFSRRPKDFTPWIEWYLGCLKRSINASEKLLETVLVKDRFWKTDASQTMSERQRKVIKRLLGGRMIGRQSLLVPARSRGSR